MEEELFIKTLLSDITRQKEAMVEKLISHLKSTDNSYVGNQIALALVDHFRDERIEPCLVEIIKEPRWKNREGTILYSLREYTNDPKYLYFLVDMLLKNEKNGNGGKIHMGAGGYDCEPASPAGRQRNNARPATGQERGEKEKPERRSKSARTFPAGANIESPFYQFERDIIQTMRYPVTPLSGF